MRTHEDAARQGNPVSIAWLAAIERPPFPEALRSLWEQFQKLNGMRGVTQFGLARLTPGDIDAANRLLRWELEPHEVEALIALDIATLYPEPKK